MDWLAITGLGVGITALVVMWFVVVYLFRLNIKLNQIEQKLNIAINDIGVIKQVLTMLISAKIKELRPKEENHDEGEA